MSRSTASLFVCAGLAACGLLGDEEQAPQALEQLQVVADDAPFDPREAVDDDDDEVGVLEQGDGAPEDQPAFQEGRDGERETPAAGRERQRAPTRAAADRDRRAWTQRAGEHAATPDEVAALREARIAEAERVAGAEDSDGEAKRALATNPPAEPLGPPEPIGWTIAGTVFEGLLLAALAAMATGVITLWRAFPKATLMTAVLAAGAIAMWLSHQAD